MQPGKRDIYFSIQPEIPNPTHRNGRSTLRYNIVTASAHTPRTALSTAFLHGYDFFLLVGIRTNDDDTHR